MYNWVDHFERYLLLQHQVSFNTFKAYMTDVRVFTRFLADYAAQTDVFQLNSQHLQLFFGHLQEQCISKPKAMRIINALKLFCGYLHQKHEQQDLTDVITSYAQTALSCPLFVTKEKLQAILARYRTATDYEELRILLIVQLGSHYGLSIHQIAALKISDFRDGMLCLAGKKQKSIKLLPGDHELVKRYCAALFEHHQIALDCNYLFPVKFGVDCKPLSSAALVCCLKKIFKKKNDLPLPYKTHLGHGPTAQLYAQKHPRP